MAWFQPKKILVFTVLAVFLLTVSRAPYFNLLIRHELIAGILLVLLVRIQNWDHFLVLFGLTCFLIWLTITGRFHLAEKVGFVSYLVLFSGIIELIRNCFKSNHD